MGGMSRILVRASGTEDAVRVMVEAEELGAATAAAEELVEIIGRELGGAK